MGRPNFIMEVLLMALLDDVKLSLGISHAKLDSDISGAIAACKVDLSVSGVVIINDTDALTEQAVKLYCRAWYNYQGNSERWERAYVALKQSMALCGDYNEVITP